MIVRAMQYPMGTGGGLWFLVPANSPDDEIQIIGWDGKLMSSREYPRGDIAEFHSESAARSFARAHGHTLADEAETADCEDHETTETTETAYLVHRVSAADAHMQPLPAKVKGVSLEIDDAFSGNLRIVSADGKVEAVFCKGHWSHVTRVEG
jgi:hypothetical protein